MCYALNSRLALKAAKAAAEKAKEEEEEEEGPGGLLVELEDKDVKRERETNLWFSKVCPSVPFLICPFLSLSLRCAQKGNKRPTCVVLKLDLYIKMDLEDIF